ncbi:hypothetical protein [Pontibacter vulgaris]|uniref:hypothetical protein n=1 Tax=Pontibacter vulgaris TaxID=2905679 RepID=UPI001FA73996|nr:hypothetical protein [Pontibacter vulgaris]
MNKILRPVLALAFGSFLLASCDKCEPTYTQPTTEDLDWLVYDTKDSIRFVNESNKVFTYLRTNAYTQNIPGAGYSVSDDCIEKMDTQVVNVIQQVKNQQPGLAITILKTPEDLTVNLVVEDRGTYKIDKANPTFATLDLNGFTYNNVFEVKADSTKATSLKRLLFNKEFGFLSLEMYDGRKLDLKR